MPLFEPLQQHTIHGMPPWHQRRIGCVPCRSCCCLPLRWLPTTGNTSTTIFPNTASFDACVARCSSSTCQYVTYDYVSLTCYVRSLAGIVYVG